jgi:hypothetical protein
MQSTAILLFISFLLSLLTVLSAFSYDWKNKRHEPANKIKFLSSFHDSGVMYKQSVLSKQELNQVKKDLVKLSLVEEQASIAHRRIAAVVNKRTREVFRQGSVSKLVHCKIGENYVLCDHIPVKVRIYEKVGAGMDWHLDDVLYDPPQVGVVYTFENTSDCTTRWKQGDVQTIIKESDPNSILTFEAGGAPHCVTPLKHGRRVIIKCAFVSKEAHFLMKC